MPNPSGPDRDDQDVNPGAEHVESDAVDEQAEPATEVLVEPATEVMATPEREQQAPAPRRPRGERRFTAPGFDAKETAVINTAAEEPATEIFRQRQERSTEERPKAAVPQSIPPRLGGKLRPSNQRSWGWVLALILIILALAAVAVLGTVLLTRSHKKTKASQEDQVRSTIQSFDAAVQTGDLATLRSITCGDIRDGYVNYDERAWKDTYRQVTAAKQYPVVASIDQVVVNDGHAEANVTAFMAYAPQTRSTRSFDLQYRDEQWKICQATTG